MYAPARDNMVGDQCQNISREIKRGVIQMNDSFYPCRHRPIFPGSFPPSIFGTGELNFRVRDGNGWDLTVINTGSYFFLCGKKKVSKKETAFLLLLSSSQRKKLYA